MKQVDFEKLLLKTVFCCMTSDGNIDQREVLMIETLCKDSGLFQSFDLKTEINLMINEINANNKRFFQQYFDLLDAADLSEKEELMIVDYAVKTINADEIIEYSEIKFFKNIRHRLKISNQNVLAVYPDIESFLEDDIKTDSFMTNITKQFLDIVELPQFDSIDFEELISKKNE